ncbi:MAG: cytochrome c oxidase subunit II [Actinomycetota bacterium]|nr:cytochrome c oxidase subunit II [Actinomycetota bacterium]
MVAAGAVLLGGCRLPAFGAYRPADSQASGSFALWSGLMIAALVIGGFVLALILWSVFRYRAHDDTIPKQTHQNIPWEIAYTVTPLVIVTVIFIFTVFAENKVDATPPAPAVKVHVIAYRWGWIFDYQGKNVSIHTTGTGYPQLVLPRGEPTQITLTSNDVVHEFMVPNFLFGRYAQPGVVNKFDFTPSKNGTYLGHCAFYCGLYHAQMLFTVKVVSPSSYSSFLSSHGGVA